MMYVLLAVVVYMEGLVVANIVSPVDTLLVGMTTALVLFLYGMIRRHLRVKRRSEIVVLVVIFTAALASLWYTGIGSNFSGQMAEVWAVLAIVSSLAVVLGGIAAEEILRIS